MSIFLVPSMLAMAVLVFILWPSRRQSRLGSCLSALVAIAVALGLWVVAIHVAGLPRSATPIPDQDSLVFTVLAASSEEAYLLSSDLVRISLPDGRITARYPNGKHFSNSNLGVLTSVAFGRDTLMFTYHQGADRGGWAAIRGDSWLVEPHPSRRGSTNGSIFWDEKRERFVLATFLGQEFYAPKKEDQRPRYLQSVELQIIDLQGEVSAEKNMRFETTSAGFKGMCLVGGKLYASDYAGRVCRLEEDPTGPWKCQALDGDLKKRIACPGQVFGLAPHAYLTPQGSKVFSLPPQALRDEREPVPANAFVRLDPDGPRPHITWYAKNGGHVYPLGDSFIYTQFVDEQEAQNLGHVEYETLVEKLDERGQRIGHTYIRRMTLPVLIFEAGEELVILDGDLSARVRLDKNTFARLDGPCPVQAARQRLSVWGGPWLPFELALAFSLLGILIVLMVLALQILPRARKATCFTMQRVALVYLLVAVPTLLDLISRTWHL